MPHYRCVGEVPRKRHTAFRGPDGRHRPEELVGHEGFSGASSLLYHRRSPSALLGIEAVEEPHPRCLRPNHPLTPRHLRTGALAAAGDPVLGRRVLAGNAHVTLCWWAGAESSGLHVDAVGDELVYVQRGTVTLESTFGALAAGPGDHVVVPASTVHRWVVHEPAELLVLEAAGHVDVPERYRTAAGQLREGAPYSERDLRAPTEPLLVDDEEVPVLVRTRHGLTRHVHATHPFDVVGWDGCAYPWAFQVRDFEPITGRLHQPPPVHQTFAGPRFVVCAFVPRLLDTDPDAVKVPYHHANVDSDEVLFYSDGDFLSRAGSGIERGSVSLHPAGFVHGPQPGSLEASAGAERTVELAVMLDTFDPLQLGEAAAAPGVEDPGYWRSWAR